MKDRLFYVKLPALMAQPLIVTVLFFYQLDVAYSKNWDAAWMTANYWIYALGSVAALEAVLKLGFWVDGRARM